MAVDTESDTPCIVCGARRWSPLPVPGPRSMASDWRVIDAPLVTVACDSCGVARRILHEGASEDLYRHGNYELYAHAPTGLRERARQFQYAKWIEAAVGAAPQRVLDIGCGNGSLLAALAEVWPHAKLSGCDAAPAGVAFAQAMGLHVWAGTAADVPQGTRADLVVSVNVIEHTAQPDRFLSELARAMTADGTLVLVCPDGSRPDVELLIADHAFSFSPGHVVRVCERAGLVVERCDRAPSALGHFQMVVARRAANAPRAAETSAAASYVQPAERWHYLDAWRQLDARLSQRVGARAVCFGAGEAAGLLRAYAPNVWQRVRACTVDGAASGWFGDKPMVPLTDVAPDETVVVGVRPADQTAVGERLRGQFQHVTTWHDLIEGIPA